MNFGEVFWWNFWVTVQILIVVGVIIALGFYIRWGKRKSAIAARPRAISRPDVSPK